MDILAIGGDARYAWIARLARNREMEAGTFALEKAGMDELILKGWEDGWDARVWVMPRPRQGVIATPLSGTKENAPIHIEEIVRRSCPETMLAFFGPGDEMNCLADERKIICLDEDERLMEELARQTAEGAIWAIQQKSESELWGENILIIGYGRIGRALSTMLKGYGACIAIAARRKEVLKKAEEAGCTGVSINEMGDVLPGMDVIISTVPCQVVDERMVERINRQALVVDLASAPYGVDMDACWRRYINGWREPGLPGRYCPCSAGKAMLDSLCRYMKGEKEYG